MPLDLKKVLILLFLFTIITSIFSPSLEASSSIDLLITASSEKIYENDTVDIVISLSNYDSSSSAIGGLQLNIPIDTNYFEFIPDSNISLLETEPDDLNNSAYDVSKNQLVFMYAYTNSNKIPLSKDTKEVFSFSLRVKTNLPLDGSVSISCSALAASAEVPPKSIITKVTAAAFKDDSIIQTEEPPSNNAEEQEETTAPVTEATQPLTEKNQPSSKPAANPGSSPSTTSISTIPPSEENISYSASDNEIFIDISSFDTLSGDTLILSNTKNRKITTQKTDQGIIIRGEDLKDLVISAQNGNSKNTLTINPPNLNNSQQGTYNETTKQIVEILITENDGNIIAYIDADQDGVFDTPAVQNDDEIKNSSEKEIPFFIATSVFLTVLALHIIITAKNKKQRSQSHAK